MFKQTMILNSYLLSSNQKKNQNGEQTRSNYKVDRIRTIRNGYTQKINKLKLIVNMRT